MAAIVDAFRPALVAPMTPEPGTAASGSSLKVTIVGPDGSLSHAANWPRILAARDQGLTGAALLTALGSAP